MADYSATVTADMSGYTTSMQQALAMTKEYTAANEGLYGLIGRTGTRAINQFNDSMGVTQKAMKANVAEAANYQQALGKVSANAVAAGASVAGVQKATKEVARELTGNIGSAVEIVSTVQKMGFSEPKGIKAMSKAMIELGAATGESGAQITSSLMTMQRSYSQIPNADSVKDLGDSLVKTSAAFGASAGSVADFSKNIAPFADQIGMSKTAVIGFSTAFSKMGEDGYRSSNVFAKVLTDIDGAVRDGLPTLGVYAETMGKTYAETEKLAKKDPTEFILQFTEALSKQGDQGIRTLEQLGLEGVRYQKSIKALTSSGDARGAVEMAMASFGGGTTEKSAAEQLNGLNEQAMKLQESLGQVAANSGKPMLGWLEDLGSVSGTAAQGLAKLTGSSAFQTIMSVLAGAGAIGGIAAKTMGGIYAAGSVGGAYSQFNAGGRLTNIQDTLKRNQGKLLAGGAAGMALGQITGMPGMNTMGMMALMAGSVLPGGMNMSRKGWNFLTQDAIGAMNTSMRGKRDDQGNRVVDPKTGRPVGGWGADMGRSTRLDTFWDESTQSYGGRQTPAEGGFLNKLRSTQKQVDMVDLQADTMKRLKGREGEHALKEGYEAKFKKLSNMVDESGKDLAYRTELIDFSSKVRSGVDVGELEKHLDELEKKADTEGPRQTAKNRGKYMGRQMGRGMGQLGRGGAAFGLEALSMGAGALMSPVGLAVGGVAIAGGSIYNEVKENQRLQGRIESTDLSSETNKVAEAFGLVTGSFTKIGTAGDELATTFDDLASSTQASIDRQGGGKGQAPDVSLTSEEFGAIESREPVADLKFQKYRVLGKDVGGERQTPEATAELLATYGTNLTGETIAAMQTDLKAQGMSNYEVNKSVEAAVSNMGDSSKVLGLAAQNWDVNNTGQNEFSEPGVELIKTWVANQQAAGLSDQERATQISEMVTKETTGMTEEEANAFAQKTYEAAGILGKTPTMVGRDSNYQQMDPEERKKADAEQLEANKAAAEQWKRNTFGSEKGTRESAIEGFGLNKGTSDLADAIATSAKWQTQEEVAGAALTETIYGGARGNIANEAFTTKQAQQQDPAYVEKIKNAGAIADAMNEFAKDYKPGDVGRNKVMAESIAGSQIQFYGGDEAAALRALKSEGRQVTDESTGGQINAQLQQEVQQRKAVAQQGMDPLTMMKTRMQEANAEFDAINKEIAAGKGGVGTEEDLAAAKAEVQASRDNAVTVMQGYLKGARNLERQLEYQAEDYNKSVMHTNEDYQRQRSQAQEQFDISQSRAKRDHLKQMKYMEEDYNKSINRSTRQYNLQRERANEDHTKQMLRHYEDMAKGMTDIYSRMRVEQTWSAEGLLANMEEQAASMAKQIENLDKLRKSGMSQSAIDMMGLNDPAKAQQLDRLVGDLSGEGGGALVNQFNQAAGARKDIAGDLFGKENDLSTRRAEDDFQQSLDRMAEDRKTWLADAEADYIQSRNRTEDSFNTQMKDARESFALSMEYMADAHATALERMADAQKTAIKRAREGFDAMYEGMTSDFTALEEATTTQMEGGKVKWPNIIQQGVESTTGKFSSGMGEINKAWTDSMITSMNEAFGKDSKMVESSKQLITLLGLINAGGGPGPGEQEGQTNQVVEMTPSTKSGAGYNDVTGGKGEITNSWHAPGHYGSSGTGWHTGMDVGVPVGTPVYAQQDATVESVKNTGSKGYGYHVTLKDSDENIQIIYGHLSSVNVNKGQAVKKGQGIARTGNTGNSFGPHLHVEARKPPYAYGNDVFPGPWMAQGGIATRSMVTGVGDSGPEAVIPLNSHGIDVLADAMRRAYGQANSNGTVRTGDGGGDTYITYTTNEDHSVTVSGPVEVISSDPEKIGRELERKARQRALVSPNRRT